MMHSFFSLFKLENEGAHFMLIQKDLCITPCPNGKVETTVCFKQRRRQFRELVKKLLAGLRRKEKRGLVPKDKAAAPVPGSIL